VHCGSHTDLLQGYQVGYSIGSHKAADTAYYVIVSVFENLKHPTLRYVVRTCLLRGSPIRCWGVCLFRICAFSECEAFERPFTSQIGGRELFSPLPFFSTHLLLKRLPDIIAMKIGVDHARSRMKGQVSKKLTDEFVLGLVDLVTTGRMMVWLVVACQTYMDIYDIAKGATSYGLSAFEHSLERAEITELEIEQHCKRDTLLCELML